ncbi:MAG: TetR family transcriptional regulator [Chloroflexi bacterium]|nr:MAG: TetR family transcriptional regulator [Chloroflexota bacterium]
MALKGDGDSASARRSHEPDAHRHLRRRGAQLEEAILTAAWEELAAVGYAHLTIEAVAERAKTSRAVLYRRWPGRPALVLAAMRQQAPLLSGPVPDTGALRSDVLVLLHRISERLDAVGPEIIHGLLADYFRDDELFLYLQTQVLQVGSIVMTTILERAAARGEVRLDRVTPRIARLPLDLLRHEMFVTRTAPSESALLEIVDDIFLPLIER